MKKILIVDDEEPIREMLKITLELANFNCFEASTAKQAYAIAIDKKPNLILLDWMLPDVSGIELAKWLKRNEFTARIPIIMLTAKGEEYHKIKGLEMGADDYITKPFSTKELIARSKAVLRRSCTDLETKSITLNELELNLMSHRVSIAGETINLGPTEYKLLEFFMQHQERIYSREQLLYNVWGSTVYIEERTVDVHIRRLRKALGEFYEGFIQTVRGAGYRFSAKI